MLVRDLLRLIAASFASSVAVLGLGAYYLNASMPDLAGRPVPRWKPELGFTRDVGSNLPATELREALARPLFRLTRRPYDPAIVSQQAALTGQSDGISLPDTSQLVVKGIMIEGEKQLALIATAAAPEGIWFGLGAKVSGWTISGLNRDGVTLEAGGSRTILKLYVDNP